jgi:hypothetical protein
MEWEAEMNRALQQSPTRMFDHLLGPPSPEPEDTAALDWDRDDNNDDGRLENIALPASPTQISLHSFLANGEEKSLGVDSESESDSGTGSEAYSNSTSDLESWVSDSESESSIEKSGYEGASVSRSASLSVFEDGSASTSLSTGWSRSRGTSVSSVSSSVCSSVSFGSYVFVSSVSPSVPPSPSPSPSPSPVSPVSPVSLDGLFDGGASLSDEAEFSMLSMKDMRRRRGAMSGPSSNYYGEKYDEIMRGERGPD